MQVAVIMGSESDKKTMDGCFKFLDYFGLSYEEKIISAHRHPKQLHEYLNSMDEKGTEIIIAGAGMAAHLPGVVASLVEIPVIGVPIGGSALNGVDALYSIVQMPSGIPVACMAVGSHGAKNAAIYAATILALNDNKLKEKIQDFRSDGCRI